MNPPPLPKKTRIYGEVGTPPPIPPRPQTSVKKNIPPSLPLKRYRYNKDGKIIVGKHHLREYHRVKIYSVRGMIFYECNHITFFNKEEATQYCRIINNNKGSKSRRNYWEYTPIIANSRNSFSQSNSDLIYRKNSISISDDLQRGRKDSLSVSRNSLSGLGRSSSKQSIAKSKGNLPSRSNNVSWSNKALSSRINAISGSIGDLLGRISSSERRNFLSRLKESLNNNAIYKQISKVIHSKNARKTSKSHMIWLKVWKGCNVDCYSKDHYDVYKGLASLEINMYRFLHRVNHLKLSPQLGAIAQELAEKYAIRQKIDLNLYPSYGILYGKSSTLSALTIIRSWYETSKKYNFLLSRTVSKSALSFTQIVWESTTEFGIGVKDDNDYLFVVCVFYPKGNQNGKYKKNVHKLTKSFLDKI
uniref:SCP domain-containing protein n=1 Tax=Strongyloides papillosus TaxID=174720 RepID=A0A0N5B1X0_STREA